MTMLRLTLLSSVLLALACTDRDIVEQDEQDDPGEQPQDPGAMYAPCSAAEDCPTRLCVFPRDEVGFCSTVCGAADDISGCGLPPGDQSTVCLDIGLPSGSPACALECDAGPCPIGMRCEQIATPDGDERAICF
jgi:hypothetical protein